MPKIKLKKSHAVSFFQSLTGHTKSLIQKKLEEDSNDGYWFNAGIQGYHIWILEGRIYCQSFLGNTCIDHAYFDLKTFEYDYEKTERDKRRDIDARIAERLDDL